MSFDSRIIAEIQSKVDLLQYVGQYVTLRKRGREYVGLCPFHAEKTPSFWLNAEKQVWHCYGCDAGGDLIKFVRRYENVEFHDALRLLAMRAGVSLHESAAAQRRRSEREAIYEANAAAQRYFQAALAKHAGAQTYLRGRDIEARLAERFGIGYAPWDGLAAALRKAGVEPDAGLRAGLIGVRDGGGELYDFFRNRIMLPLYNLTGDVIAFGGRALGDEQPKYLNTPTTPVYVKGRSVYGLQAARRSAGVSGELIIVEGYFDAIALHGAGFDNAVASLGTAFTPEQARELRRVAGNLYLCFDADAAGEAATARSIDMLVSEGHNVRIVRLPEGRDPDDIIRAGGARAFHEALEASLPWVDFKIDAVCRQLAAKFARKSDIAREAMAVVTGVRDPVERDQYIKSMAERLDVSEAALREQHATAPRRPADALPDGASIRRAPPAPAPLSAERELLGILLSRPALLSQAASQAQAEDFEDPVLRRAFELVVRHAPEIEGGVNALSFFDDDRSATELSRLMAESPHLSLDEDCERLRRTLDRLATRRLERRLFLLDKELNGLVDGGYPIPQRLRDEHNALNALLRKTPAGPR